MTQELLAKIVKNSLYVKWKTTSVTHASYENVKESFKNREREILKQIQVARLGDYSLKLNPMKVCNN